tara:strand:- start:2554 stop:3684 length:1131 start_codon:yes stop_codon:yes gene_type:complete
MKKQIITLLFFAITQIVITQNKKIENVFSENILNEEFYKKPKYFPDIQNSSQFAVTLSKEGKYFIGTKESDLNIIINWENDLENYELNSSFTFSPVDNSSIFKNNSSQIFGYILNYNPDDQTGLIFELNSLKKYRLSLISDGKKINITSSNSNIDGWIKSSNIIKNIKNEITVKTNNSLFEFYINDNFETSHTVNLNHRKKNKNMKFGFFLGVNSKVKVDNFTLNTDTNYSGVNKVISLSSEDISNLIKENEKLKNVNSFEENQKIKQLENVIEILENEIKYISSINDSIEIENKKFEPFVDQIDGDYDILYTISKDLKKEIENNRNLRTENNLLIDSIKKIKNNQELFKLEYLNKLIAIEKSDTINKNDTVNKNE